MNKTIWQYPFAIPITERPQCWSILLEQRSLTQRLRRQYPDLAVRQISQSIIKASQNDAQELSLCQRQQVMLREVYLYANQKLLTYGRCVIAAHALQQKTLCWINTLGERSLGDVLKCHHYWQRKNLRISLLAADTLEYQQATKHHQTNVSHLWARRSQLIVDTQPILVTEVFFPPMSSCAEIDRSLDECAHEKYFRSC